MSLGETFSDLEQVLKQNLDFAFSLMNLVAQRHAVDELHGNEVDIITPTNLVNVRNVRMIERGSSLCLLNKSPHPFLISRKISWQNLQRHLAIEFGVLRQIHFAHSALTDFRADNIPTQFCSRGEGHGCGARKRRPRRDAPTDHSFSSIRFSSSSYRRSLRSGSNGGSHLILPN